MRPETTITHLNTYMDPYSHLDFGSNATRALACPSNPSYIHDGRACQSLMEQQYLALLEKCCAQPTRATRNAATHSLFGATLTHDLRLGFPLLTTKRVFFRGVVEELAWFLRGSTDVDELKANFEAKGCAKL